MKRQQRRNKERSMPFSRLFTSIRSNTLASPQNIQAALADSDLWRLKLATAERWGCDSFTAHATGQGAIRDQLLAPTARQPTHLLFMSYNPIASSAQESKGVWVAQIYTMHNQAWEPGLGS